MVWSQEGHAAVGEDVKEGTFWRADLLEASSLLVEIIREVRPQVLVTYDEFGNYGHPDHIQAHRVATYAASLAAVPSFRPQLGEPWDIAKVYWGAMSLNRMREGLRRLRAAGDTTSFEGMDPDGPMPPFMVPDDQLSAVVDANDFADAKMRAMKAHATQITLDGPFFSLSNNLGNHVWGTEYYRIAKGERGPLNEDGLETDLFAGLE
jgi:N-acetyl-1-D-myo-inositol-2-amino-2-deoxy-alpha-D-glucopyranoside deacetylase